MLTVFQGNATTNDLWSALSEVSGKDVTAFMVRPVLPRLSFDNAY